MTLPTDALDRKRLIRRVRDQSRHLRSLRTLLSGGETHRPLCHHLDEALSHLSHVQKSLEDSLRDQT